MDNQDVLAGQEVLFHVETDGVCAHNDWSATHISKDCGGNLTDSVSTGRDIGG